MKFALPLTRAAARLLGAVGVASLLAACSADSNQASSPASAVAGPSYRPLGSNIPTTAPAGTMSDTDRQDLSNRLGGFAGR